jgi:carboxypeptidase Taq
MNRDNKARKTLDIYTHQYMDLQQRYDKLRWQMLTSHSVLGTFVAGLRLFANQIRSVSLLRGRGLQNALAQHEGHIDDEHGALAHVAQHYKGASLWHEAKLNFYKIRSYQGWEKARAQNDFNAVRAPFDALLSTQFNDVAHGKSYDDLLALQSRGLNSADVEVLMADSYRRYIKLNADFLKAAPRSQAAAHHKWQITAQDQERIVKRIMDDMGVDFARLSYREGAHAACFGYGDDVFISMHYDDKDALKTILAAVHEAGHALYRQNLPRNKAGQTLRGVAGRDMDEAMALFWEHAAVRNVGFAAYLSRVIDEETQGVMQLTPDEVVSRLMARGADKDRANADIVEYGLHGIARHGVMKQLTAQCLNAAHLPQVFNEASIAYLGHLPPDEGAGVLQDPHWFAGEFTDFDNYFMGQHYALHLYETISASHGEEALNSAMAEGNFTPITNWLCQHVWQHGALKTSQEIMAAQGWLGAHARGYESFISRKFL